MGKPVLISALLVMFLMLLLSFTVFTVDISDNASRLELMMTLILTAVLFDTKTAPKPYLTFMDKYILCSYGYLVAVMAESAVFVYFDEEADEMALFVAVCVFVAQHVGFVMYA